MHSAEASLACMGDVGTTVATHARAALPGVRGATAREHSDELDDLFGAVDGENMGSQNLQELMRVAAADQQKKAQWYVIDPREIWWWDATTSLALLFTAVVTPFEV